MVRLLFAHLSQVSSVTMPASFPPQLAELHQKSAAPALTFFVGWGLSRSCLIKAERSLPDQLEFLPVGEF